MSSAPSDLSLSPDQRYDNDQMIMAWIAALVAEGCPPFANDHEVHCMIYKAGWKEFDKAFGSHPVEMAGDMVHQLEELHGLPI
ncbi:predicted protein [Sclerotinia sclerotiorum 1980 UF-70]|uniref:Uncharacterized protein n=1 Tax=Sclerotinia sclerotiorum (strain ATCC 18683 / 1980 / Ss-1) TaxID=665079 RepID=A7EYB6_SCLS1|nr:predicted protein [Sclerotinia sclerotiorum 1980 UF-70]EDN94458.1 predicted protein [Sclerotinia sclerotiorum 1980 UF-70]